ncbi:hypothetical protein AVEN_88651-1 [Araneus ventricosus]|uniref:Uncharacterized protein n=1 Tax=Araneus ventricosus TaxID=182803 RepID=A0A4Y2C7Y6_ARAVE|nr:hypothetical protein AVEN_88651-1 [Araneus ventricosus]
MKRTTPEMASILSKLPLHASGRTLDSLRMIYRATGPMHGGSSVESCFETGKRNRKLTTRRRRPQQVSSGFPPLQKTILLLTSSTRTALPVESGLQQNEKEKKRSQ